MNTGYAIVVAGFFVGAAIMFAGADIAYATGPGNAGMSVFPGAVFLFVGVVAGLIAPRNAKKG